MLNIPTKLELMAIDPSEHIYDLLMMAVDKLGYVVQTLINAGTSAPNSTESIAISQVADQALQLAVIDMRIKNDSELINSSRQQTITKGYNKKGGISNSKNKYSKENLDKNIQPENKEAMDEQTNLLISTLNEVSSNIDYIYNKSKLR